MRPLILLAPALLTGCALTHEMERAQLTDFQVEPGAVTMTVKGIGKYGSAGADAHRGWLDEFVAANGICPNGHAVEGPRVFEVAQWNGHTSTHQYTARCTNTGES
jgi:hypothetical protein